MVNKKFFAVMMAGLFVLSFSALSYLGAVPNVYAATTTLDSSTCPGSWDTTSSTCTLNVGVTLLSPTSGNTLVIPAGTTVAIDGGICDSDCTAISNGGAIINYGTITIAGTFSCAASSITGGLSCSGISGFGTITNYGTISIDSTFSCTSAGATISGDPFIATCEGMQNYGSLYNYGTITIAGTYSCTASSGGSVTCYGIDNAGTITDVCSGTISPTTSPNFSGNSVQTSSTCTTTITTTVTSISTSVSTEIVPTTVTSTSTSVSTEIVPTTVTSTSVTTTSLTQTVTAAAISVSCSPDQFKLGQKTECTATAFAGTPPAGQISFSASGAGTFGQSPNCQTSANTLTCKVAYTPSADGEQKITATYLNDPNFLSVSASTTIKAGNAGNGIVSMAPLAWLAGIVGLASPAAFAAMIPVLFSVGLGVAALLNRRTSVNRRNGISN